MQTYHIWTIGCQMNTADSERLGSALEQLGLTAVPRPAEADVVVLNSCVVRQSAEDKVTGTLNLTQPLRKRRPDSVLALTGCMVGPRTEELQRRFPHVDLFLRPQQFEPLLELVGGRLGLDWEGCVGSLAPQQPDVATYVPIIHGCDLMCTFCIIPYRRGRQVSRSVDDIAHEVELLAARGVKEVTVLGQTVDAYGHDRDEDHDLADLFARLNDIDSLERIRFLTSHPSYMSSRIIRSVADLPKVCEHINLPVQSGDDDVLQRMRRPYSTAEYRDIISEIRDTIPDVTVSTDIIVGFPGETEGQYQNTLRLVDDLRFDKVHGAAYSTRPGTIAARTMDDDVPQDEKQRRLKGLETLQENILTDINSAYMDGTVQVLAENRKRGSWTGRTRGNKLVYFDVPDTSHCEMDSDLTGQLVNVRITRAGPWSLSGVTV
ncbi:MAG: tRNA (N6-isopentenyl adenosine(37)-C2)-methylthiotransferase MiaB [Chloroflexi bacterium]|nr:tRNA (N6-isopentenyl adenosine(37)-C2)-methylthiotransferase MiaB [Chloroflexota bacterium]MYD48969.1 tRNA (N6-isopentenyl adenosine(37)-C2)-methylthiotransferase MiaB [Chloroflexota bacterium]